jgi:hypothetical protein
VKQAIGKPLRPSIVAPSENFFPDGAVGPEKIARKCASSEKNARKSPVTTRKKRVLSQEDRKKIQDFDPLVEKMSLRAFALTLGLSHQTVQYIRKSAAEAGKRAEKMAEKRRKIIECGRDLASQARQKNEKRQVSAAAVLNAGNLASLSTIQRVLSQVDPLDLRRKSHVPASNSSLDTVEFKTFVASQNFWS